MEEDMDIDHIVEVPDTPDRLSARHDNRKYVGNPEKRRERLFPVTDEMNNHRNYIELSPLEKSYPSQNAPIFRRAQTEKNFGLGTTHSEGAERMDKGKTVITNFPSKSSRHGPIPVFNLTEENGRVQQLKPVFSHHGSKANAAVDKKELKTSIGNSSLSFVADSSNTSRNSFTGKNKLDNRTFPGPCISVDHGKSISLSDDSQSQSKTEKQVAFPTCFSSPPRGRGHKRLVRNGCISPHNIAARAKQSTEQKQSSHQTRDIEQSQAGHSVSRTPISIDDIVAEDRGCGRAKGKGVLIHPSSQGLNARTIHTASSSPVIRFEEANGGGNSKSSSLKLSGGLGGWRTTHSEKNDNQRLDDVNGHHSRRNYDVGRFADRESTDRMRGRDNVNSQRSNNVPSVLVNPEVDRSTRIHPTAETLTKRQRKRGSTSRNPNEAANNSEIMFLSSSGESSGSSMNLNPDLDRDLIEFLSSPRHINRHSEYLDGNDNNSSDARARQVEADEILARELQEQLYHDDYFEGRGIDEHLAWELQCAEGLHTSIDNLSHPTWLPRANRQPRSRSNQNPSNWRRTVPQVSFSNRMSQLRTRIRSRPPTATISSRGRRPRFPLDMDLEMRLEILEALEDAVGDLSDTGMADEIYRDFNEDDYEMLLALDERNHQHTGASANQINNLPQSTVQTDNFSEACAICLETPVKGETIRHLLCLHKFHKDCIDPWLQRKTSCPVCKSSIT